MTRRRLGARFRRLLVSSTVSNLGDGLQLAAFPLVAAAVTNDPVLVSCAVLAPRLAWLFAPGLGVVVDRVDRRRLMIGVDAARVAVVAVLGWLILSGNASVALLVAAGLLLGVGEVLYDTAAQAVIPAVVGDDLERANARLLTSQRVTNQFLGQPAGGWLSGLSSALPFFANAVTFACSAVVLGGIRGRFRPARRARGAGFRQELMAGLRYCARDPIMRRLTSVVALFAVFEGIFAGQLVLFSIHVLDAGPGGFGALLGIAAVGAVAGAVVAPRVAGWGVKRVLLLSTVLAGAAYVLFGLSGALLVAGAWLALNSAMTEVWNVITAAVRQRIVPDEYLGRVVAAYRTAAWGLMPVGYLAGGVINSSLGPRAPALVAGVGLGLCVVVLLRLPGRGLQRAASPTAPQTERAGAVDAGQRGVEGG